MTDWNPAYDWVYRGEWDGTAQYPSIILFEGARQARVLPGRFDWGRANDPARRTAYEILLDASKDQAIARAHAEAFLKDVVVEWRRGRPFAIRREDVLLWVSLQSLGEKRHPSEA
jgi:hypothetical protein